MSEKFAKLLTLISRNEAEIEDVHSATDEYYFRFRSKSFSILNDKNGIRMFAYPQWKGSFSALSQLLDEGQERPETVFVQIVPENLEMKGQLVALFELLKNKHLGLDEFFASLGIE